MLKYILTLSSIFFIFLSSVAVAQLEVQPDLKFKKIRTAHFDIIFNAERQDLGLLYAEKLEKAHLYLAHFFSKVPDRTVVIINDKTDITNGAATRVPYPYIMAYPVLPGPEESLADTGDWAFELLAHEYTHILSFEPAVGVVAGARAIFGTIAAPNLLLPRWWLEGLAVQMETRLSRFGRLRSIYQEANLRALAESNQLMDFSLAEANEFIPSWPEGARPYLFGSIMWSQMIADRGDAVIDILSLRHGGRVPFFVEAPAKESFGRTYPVEYDRALRETQLRAIAQVEILKTVPVTPMQTLQVPAKYLSAPTISPDGRYLAMVTVSDTDRREVKILKRSDKTHSFVGGEELKTLEKFKERELAPVTLDGPPSGSIQRVSWFHSQSKLIYDKVDAINRIERYSDLSTYDLPTQKTEKLTHGLRGREPAISPDDQSVVFVKLSGSKTELALLSLKDKSVSILFSGALQERISFPVFLKAGEILFSLRKDTGVENLYRFNIATKQAVAVLTEFPDVRFAEVTPQGVFFASSANGTHNIYLADLNLQKARPVSNTTTAFFTFGWDPNTQDLYSTQMSPHGMEVVRLDSKDWQATPAKLPQVAHLFADRYPDPPKLEMPPLQYEVQDYSAGEYLWPRYWFPSFATSTSDTGVVFQAATSGFDPLKKHSYSLVASWDTGINRGSLLGTYLNQQTSLPILLGLYQQNSFLSDQNNRLTDTGGQLSVLPDLFPISRYLGLQVGWQYFQRETNFGVPTVKRTGPFGILSFANYSQSGEQISPEDGGGAYLGAYDYIQTQDYLTHSQFTAGGVIYMSKFLPSRHALMLKLNGVYTPEEISPIYGVQTNSIAIASDTTLPIYLMRGYKTGQFYGRNLVNANMEYRFPLKKIYRGSGTDPLYFHRLNGAIVADGVAVDGRYANDKDQIYEVVTLKRQFYSVGAEVKLETTVAYNIPVNFVLGYYLALNTPTGAAGSLGLSLQIGAQ
jgi:Tol biopolymer transport system component